MKPIDGKRPGAWWEEGIAELSQDDSPRSADADVRDLKSAPSLLEAKMAEVRNPLVEDPDFWDDYRYKVLFTTIPRRLHGLSDVALGVAIRKPPGEAGQPWDALVAAVCEHIAETHGHPVPAWCSDPNRFIDPPQFVPGGSSRATDCIQRLPAAFVRHGALPDIAEIDDRIGDPYRWSARTLTASRGR